MNTDAPPAAPECEKTDASPGLMALMAFGLVLIVGLCLMVAAGVYRHRDLGGTVGSALAPNGRFQNGVDERTGIEQAWKEQDRLVHKHLDGYGWIDRAGGVVHIPIDRAMDLILAEQKPSGPPSAQTKAAP
jgi:hypothetical protein